MKFIDLHAQYQQLKTSIDANIHKVLDHGQFILGPEVHELEAKLSAMANVAHCITCSSGTTAIQIALMALDIGPGDEVITSPFSFFATAEMILLIGATPVYVDVDPKTYNLDPAKLEQAITKRTKCIMPVSLFGQCADLDQIDTIAAKYGLFVIEDAAQSFGASYKGKPSCSLTTIACTSFFPSKPLGCYGDGGACFTNDDDLAHKMRVIQNQGQDGRYNHVMVGINGRFDTIQAAVLLAKLDTFAAEITQRQEIARLYHKYLKGLPLTLPYIAAQNISAYAQYTIQIDDRDRVSLELGEKNIPTAVHYPKGLHQQLNQGKNQQHFPVTEYLASRVLSLPFHIYLTEEQIIFISEALSEICLPARALCV